MNFNKKNLFFPVAFGVFLVAGIAWAGVDTDIEVIKLFDWVMMFGMLGGGLILFLHGMDSMSTALQNVAGDQMKLLLKKFTTNRFTGLTTGAVVTSIIQSSSVTTVMLVGFVSAGLMTFASTVPVILGANIGTTITAQLLAFKISYIAPFLMIGGFLLSKNGKSSQLRRIGSAIFGLALIFFGMDVMSSAMIPLRDYQPFIEVIIQMSNPLFAIFIAACFTALVQSSSATMGMVVVLAIGGLINLQTGVALAIGANIGTSITAILASIGATRSATRVAIAHIIFNVTGALLVMFFIPQIVNFVEGFGGGVARQIANAHTVFNIAIAIIFLPFVTVFVNVVIKLLPDKKDPVQIEMQPKFLISKQIIKTPGGVSSAVGGIQQELVRVSKIIKNMLTNVLPAVLSGNEAELLIIKEKDKIVNKLIHDIIEHAIIIHRISGKIEKNDFIKLEQFTEVANLLEALGDYVKELVYEGLKSKNQKLVISKETKKLIENLHHNVSENYERVIYIMEKINNDGISSTKMASIASQISKANVKREKIEKKLSGFIYSKRIRKGAQHRTTTLMLEKNIIHHFKEFSGTVYEIAKIYINQISEKGAYTRSKKV